MLAYGADSRADQFQKEASSPGLVPEDNLMIVEKCAAERSSEGRLRSNGEADRKGPRAMDGEIAPWGTGARLPRT